MGPIALEFVDDVGAVVLGRARFARGQPARGLTTDWETREPENNTTQPDEAGQFGARRSLALRHHRYSSLTGWKKSRAFTRLFKAITLCTTPPGITYMSPGPKTFSTSPTMNRACPSRTMPICSCG